MGVCPVLHSFCIDHESRCLLCLLLGQFNSHQILALCCSDMWHLFLLGRLQNLEKQHVSFFSVLFLSVKYAGQFGGICVVCVLHHWAGELRRGLSTEAVEWRGGVERAAAFRGGSGSSGRWEGILSWGMGCSLAWTSAAWEWRQIGVREWPGGRARS